jgi:hypothetical protein
MTEIESQKGKRNYAIGFSIAGSLLIILFLAFINYSVGGRFPWFIFPSYAVLWWPIGTILNGKGSAKLLSLIGSLITIGLLFLTNYLTSWNYPWFLFPSFGILWWPIAMFFGTKNHKLFSLVGSAIAIAFFIATNLITTPSIIWFHYPLFAVIWWPLRVFFAESRTSRLYSVLGALIIASFLTIDNLAKTPDCPWVLLTYFPVIMWPVSMFLRKRLGRLDISLALSLIGIGYYTALNMYVFKGFPWAIFPTYALLWWPMAIGLAKRGKFMAFSVAGSLLTAALFITVNWITTPTEIWAVYPIFAIAWWPLAIYYFRYRRSQI